MRDLLHAGTSWEYRGRRLAAGAGGIGRPQLLPGMSLAAGIQEADGSAVLRITAQNREQIGYLNRLLMEEGITLYEVKPVQGRLEEWFLSMSSATGRPPGAGVEGGLRA